MKRCLLLLLLTGCASAPPVTDAPQTIASLRTRAAADIEELPMDPGPAVCIIGNRAR